jgi:2-oxoglutarate ferredoxin oxidoreductase subunit beta
VRLRADGGAEIFDGDGESLVWDAHRDDPSLAFTMSRLTLAKWNAAPFGVFRAVERPVYDDEMGKQLDDAKQKRGEGDLAALLASGDTWSIDES